MRLNIDFERMKEIYGDEIEEIINENIDIIEKNIQFLNDLKFEDAEGIFEMYPDLFMNFPKKFEEKILKLFKCKRHYTTDELHRQAIELAGLKRFLLDYTLIAERTAIEVNLFENYLIYAQMMGIAKKVAKQFKELYPDIVEQSAFYSYDNIIFINACASHGISEANSAKSRAESYSSGGGGFSSGGGGGGSFGGGGGGGGFR